MPYPNMTTRTLKSKMNNDIHKFIDLAYKIAKRSIPQYSNKFSKKIYIQWQLFLILALKIYFDTSYRDLIILLDYNTSIVEQLSLEYISHFTTV